MPSVENTMLAPRAFDVILRDRLIQKIELAQDHKVTLISAPPGYGKTTLASQFAYATDNVVWHTVEERERDFPTFIAECIRALQTLIPDIDLVLNQGHLEPEETAALLANALRASVKNHLFIILDDIHLLHNATQCETWLRAFTTNLPPKCHLILLSRSIPKLPIAEMVARREVLAIGQEELRFTQEEIVELSKVAFNNPQPLSTIQSLMERLEGWPAGIILALQPLPAPISQAFLSSEDGPEALFDILAGMMLDAQPPPQQDFLFASSTFDRFTPPLITQVLGIQNTAYYTSTALVKNLFLTRVGGKLMYHNLFRNFLQRTIAKRNPELFQTMHLKAGRWFSQNDQLEDAFEHFLTAQQPEEAALAIETALSTYYTQGKFEVLLRWYHALREHDIHNANLAYVAATIYITQSNFEQALTALDEVTTLATRTGNDRLLAEARLQHARIDLQKDQHLAAIAQTEHLLHHNPDIENLYGRAYRILGKAYFKLGQTDTALAHFEKAIPLTRKYGDKPMLANLLQDVQLVYLRVGRLTDAGACLQEVVAIARSLNSKLMLAQALNDLGYHYHQHGDYAEALTTLQEGFSIVASLQNRRVESYLLWSLADLQRDLGTYQEAWQLYNRALEFTANREASLRANLLINASILRRWQGNLEEAEILAEEAYLLADALSLELEKVTAHIMYWASHTRQVGTPTALEAIYSQFEALHKLKASSEMAMALILCADLSLQLKDKVATNDFLSEATRLLEEGARIQPAAAEILHSPQIESYIRANATRFASLLNPINKLRKTMEAKSRVIEFTEDHAPEFTYNLRVYTLGREKLEQDNIPVLPSQWRATAARELFFYWLFIGPKTREQTSLEFWPDSSTAKVRSNFHTTLYRVRQALGENVVIFDNDRYMINPQLDIWCDAHEFQEIIQRAQNQSVRDARTEDLYKRAVNLYQGEFLPGLDAEWLVNLRERLHEDYIDALFGLGSCVQARSDYKQAVRIYKQVLKIDPFREEVHRAVMQCFSEQGERQKVYQHYKYMLEEFHKHLEVEPTRETLLYAKTLLR